MSLDQFGLRHSPFRPQSTDGSVYAGSQQIALAGGLKRALASPDAVITVSGEVGVGKTVSVRYALGRLGATSAVARIGRVHLNRDEILDVLLDEFKVASKPASALQRYNALQRLLRNWAEVGTRVFIIVEDVERLGADALAELESMTAADSGDEPGAHLILMGGPKLRKFLKSPTLARLKQRVRRSLILDPFTAEETRAYVSHQIHEAGGDVSNLFDDAAIDIVHACSNGIARVINTVCEAMLYHAEDIGAPRVTAALAFDVARQDFDYEGGMPDAQAASKADTPEATTQEEPEPTFTQTVAEDLAPSLGTTILGDALADLPEVAPPPGVPTDIAGLSNVDDAADDDIPELIQDTNPGMPAIDPDALLRSARRQPVTTAEELATLREKTDSTQPSLPVLNAPDEPPAADARPSATEVGEELLSNAYLEPRAPEPLSKTADPADSQTIRALDDALRPDTQLLQTLEEPIAPVVDDRPVPLGLRPEIGATAPSVATPPPTENKAVSEAAPAKPTEAEDIAEELPTLSTAMRIERETKANETPPPASTVQSRTAVEPKADAKGVSKELPKPGPAKEPIARTQPDKAPAAPAPTAAPAAPRVPPASPSTPANAGNKPATPAGDVAPNPAKSADVVPPAAVTKAASERPLGDDEPTETPIEASTEIPATAASTLQPPVPQDSPKTTATPEATLPDDARTDKVDRDIAATEALKAETPAAEAKANPAPAAEPAPAPKSATKPAQPAADPGGDNELPDLSLMPEITLDKKLEEHQQEAQAKVDEEAARMVELAAENEDADEETKAKAAEVAKKREEEEQRKRIESLAARFENAKSIEDVMDDTAAETLFGEEFSQIAAAVTAMHESQTPESSPEASEASNDPANIGAVDDAQMSPEAADAFETVLELEPEPAKPAPAAATQAAPEAPKPAAEPAPPKIPTPKPAAPAPQAAKPTMPRPSPAASPKMPDIESSAARRLEMVRALNQKAGKPMPNIPNEPGEEIVLGSEDSSPTCSGPRPEPIENQFGESMTAKLRALSEESIAQMQQQEEEEEKKAKKGGLLSRFRRG